jgi:TP901 family phage tail tape measure protein
VASENFDIGIVLRLVNRATSGLRSATSELKNMQKARERANKEFAKAANMRQAAEGVARVARAMRGAFATPIKVSEDFGAAMSKVEALSGSTGDSLMKLREQAKLLGETTKFTAVESAEAMGFMAMAGFDTEKIMATLPTTLNLSTAAGTDLARTSDILTDIMGAFGKDASEATNVADVLTRAFTGSNTTLETLFETMKVAGPIATDFGVSLEHVSAMAGVLGSAGLKGSLGGTALRSFFASMAGPRRKGRKAMAFLGIDPKTAAGDLKQPLVLLKEIAAKTKEMGSAKRGAVLTAIFGREALAGVSNLLRSVSSGAMNDMVEKMGDMGKTAESVATIMQTNARGSTVLLMSAIEGLQLAVGDALAPALAALKDTLRGVVTWITEFTKAYPNLTRRLVIGAGVVTVLTTALGGLMFVLGAFLTAKGTIILGFGALVTVLGAVKVAAVAALLPLLPYIAVFTAITTVVGGLVIAIRSLIVNWDKLSKLVEKRGVLLGLRDFSNFVVDDTISSGKEMLSSLGNMLTPGAPESVEAGTLGALQAVRSEEAIDEDIIAGKRTRGVVESNVGGVITIKVDDERVRVDRMEAVGGVDFEADTGSMVE